VDLLKPETELELHLLKSNQA